MKPVLLIAACVCVVFLAAATQPPAPAVADAPAHAARDESASTALGWRLALATWTFHDEPVLDVIDLAARHGISAIDLHQGQYLDATQTARVAPGMSAADIERLLKHAADRHVAIVSMGVFYPTSDEKATRAIFQLAKDLHVGLITVEPKEDAWDVVEKLAKEFHIQAACHNHPQPSTYWNPDTVLKHLAGRDSLLGDCADTGHWTRCGLSAVDCLKKMEGHVLHVHFKDIAPADKTGKDKPWGTGAADAKGMLAELARQHFRGAISIEYEDGKGKALEENVAKCVIFFDATAKELAKSAKGAPKGS